MNPIAFTIGTVSIYWYSIMICTGVILALFIIRREAAKYGIPKEYIFNLAFWALIFGIIGARLYFVLFKGDYYSTHLPEIFKIWEGGAAIHGGIIAGLLVVLFYTRKYKVKLLRMTDIIVPGLIIAQAIGRWGNFFNGEAHGGPVTLEFLKKFFIPDFIINGMYINGTYFHPTFLYESLWCILGFIILLILRHYKYTKLGQMTGFYLAWYSFGRFFIEGLRTDSLMFMGLRTAQIISIILFVVGIIIFALSSRGAKFDNLYKSKEGEKDVVF